MLTKRRSHIKSSSYLRRIYRIEIRVFYFSVFAVICMASAESDRQPWPLIEMGRKARKENAWLRKEKACLAVGFLLL